jgi:nitrite reductase/ring-hydroxylating ferredoxin subunit
MGWIEDEHVVCPLHGYKFHLQTGFCSIDAKLKAKTFKLAPAGEDFVVEE